MFKLALGSETYKLPKIPSTFDELVKITQAKFKEKLPVPFEFSYTDTEGDNITVSNELDLQNAIQFFDSQKATSIKFLIRPQTKTPSVDLNETAAIPTLSSSQSQIGSKGSADGMDQTQIMKRVLDPKTEPKPLEGTLPLEHSMIHAQQSTECKATAEKFKFPCFPCIEGDTVGFCPRCHGQKYLQETASAYPTVKQSAQFIRYLFEQWTSEIDASGRIAKPTKQAQTTTLESKPVGCMTLTQDTKPVGCMTQVQETRPVGCMTERVKMVSTEAQKVEEDPLNSTSFLRKFKVVESRPWGCYGCHLQFKANIIRYCCMVCDNYDLCEGCENKLEHEHPLIKLRRTLQAPLEIEVKSNENQANILGGLQPQAQPPVQQVFVKDGKFSSVLENVSPTDNLVVMPKSRQYVSIVYKNNGTLDWTAGRVYLECISGFQKGAQYQISQTVRPGEIVDFGVVFDAPEKAGKSDLSFKLYSTEKAQFFGQKGAIVIDAKDDAKVNLNDSAIYCRTIDRKAPGDDKVVIAPVSTVPKDILEMAEKFTLVLGGKANDYIPYITANKATMTIDQMVETYISMRPAPQRSNYYQAPQQQSNCFKKKMFCEDETEGK